MNGEIRNMFHRSNILVRRVAHCSTQVKVILFRAFCMCIYDSALWMYYRAYSFNKLRSCYHRCVKIFFDYKRWDSMTNILLQLALPNFNTIILNGSAVVARCYMNSIVKHLCSLGLPF